uniref:NADH dehydrogenase subunit 1 n=1 Tax=Sclerodermus sichuanensis TaxID=592144 RepID=UPI0021157312|nr:NADH dehydrogenase subunit 1 [Sclerodermus sichuanensis]UTN43180.1 NADH dehydrogenase subunit 1 [Sclerodermus sichuanensis]
MYLFGDLTLILMNLWLFLSGVVMILIGVAFMSLLERKIMSYVQYRKGPNKVGIYGILQPFSDAIKLFSKEEFKLFYSEEKLYFWVPLYMISISLISWITFPFYSNWPENVEISGMVLMCIFSLGVYYLMYMGWSSVSSYSYLGGVRSIAQTISYEVGFSMVLLSLFFFLMSSEIYEMISLQNSLIMFIVLLPLLMNWVIVMLAELNRTPFDFSEGESELVSGFNVEYSGVKFAYIFMSEYSMILFMSYLMSMMFFSKVFELVMMILIWVFSSLILMVRSFYPRFRYDLLMYLMWLDILPELIGMIIMIIMIEIY